MTRTRPEPFINQVVSDRSWQVRPESLDATLGERWARGGRLLVKFTNVLWPDEPVQITAGLGGPATDDSTRETVLARVEKADGTVVIVAEGSVPRA